MQGVVCCRLRGVRGSAQGHVWPARTRETHCASRAALRAFSFCASRYSSCMHRGWKGAQHKVPYWRSGAGHRTVAGAITQVLRVARQERACGCRSATPTVLSRSGSTGIGGRLLLTESPCPFEWSQVRPGTDTTRPLHSSYLGLLLGNECLPLSGFRGHVGMRLLDLQGPRCVCRLYDRVSHVTESPGLAGGQGASRPVRNRDGIQGKVRSDWLLFSCSSFSFRVRDRSLSAFVLRLHAYRRKQNRDRNHGSSKCSLQMKGSSMCRMSETVWSAVEVTVE